MPKKAASTTPASHAEELRQAEDQWVGEGAPRTPDGKLERGHGSFYQQLSPERRRHHAALEKAVAAEAEAAKAAGALHKAQAELASAREQVAASWVA